jgi:hypothetical protein
MFATAVRRKYRHLLLLCALMLAVATALPAVAATAKTGKTFPTPEKAVQELVSALQGNDTEQLSAILGPGSSNIVSSGDPVMDRENRERFVQIYKEKHSIGKPSATKAVLVVGKQAYPFPIPMVKKGEGWIFDTKAGREEILNRRVGRNELAVIDVMRAYVEAQRDYATMDVNHNGIADFAQKIRSTPGKKDGLYWEAKEGEEESPFGPLAAEAASEGYSKPQSEEPVPYHGYYYKILTAQGSHAQGGGYDYIVNGNMVLGFALLAYPAQYGSSGVMSFIVNQNGTVYQKNLGKNTASIASAMKLYDPDQSWKKVAD